MTEQTTISSDVIEIDLQRLLRGLLRKSWLVVLVSVLCALAVFAGAFFLVTPQYESTVTFYVHNGAPSLSSGDISASRGLVDTYIVILDTRETLQEVIDRADVDLDHEMLRKMIKAEALDETEVFCVGVTSPSPREAQRIAQAISEVLPQRIAAIIEGASAKVIDAAVMAESASFPQYGLCTLIGLLVGFGVSVGIIVLRELTDTTIREETDILRACDYHILAAVPDMTSRSSPGREIGFGASEAYKQLPAKLQYCFADEKDCRVIGITSAVSGEGKSVTAINLANTLSRFQKRVVLVDCDLRCPAVANRLPVSQGPGLSAYLSCQCAADKLFQMCRLKEKERAFHVVTAGEISPNPVELLSSSRMAQLLDKLRKDYDYVILDLPPVGEVSDALAVAGETDGIILVVRRHVCSGDALRGAVGQLRSVNARILGVIYNCAAGKVCSGGKDYSETHP